MRKNNKIPRETITEHSGRSSDDMRHRRYCCCRDGKPTKRYMGATETLCDNSYPVQKGALDLAGALGLSVVSNVRASQLSSTNNGGGGSRLLHRIANIATQNPFPSLFLSIILSFLLSFF
jgi:hypothetical protein